MEKQKYQKEREQGKRGGEREEKKANKRKGSIDARVVGISEWWLKEK